MKSKNENATLYYDEISTIQAHLGSNYDFITANQSFCNHTENRVLKKLIKDFTQCLKDENKHLERLLQVNGIQLMPAFVAHSNAQIESILFGANSTDTYISAALSMNIATSLIATSKALDKAICDDTVIMYGHFHMKKAVLGAKLLQLSKDKHWISVPPTTPLISR